MSEQPERADRPGSDVPPRVERLDGAVLRRWAVAARSALGAVRDSIDGLNVFPVPDADTGTNMYLTLDAAVGATLDVAGDPGQEGEPDVALELDRFARAALLGARGNSGVIVSQLVRGLVEGLREHPEGAGPHEIAAAFERASRAAYAAVAEPEEGTILTVASRAARAATEAADAGAGLVGVVEAANAAGRAALEDTPSQLDALGEAGVVDAGGAGLLVVVDALRRVLTGASEPLGPVGIVASFAETHPGDVGPCGDARYDGPRYEVMFVVESGLGDEAGPVRAALAALGDSVLLVGGGRPDSEGRSGPWRGHVHADEPDAVLAAVLPFGTPTDVTVTDLLTGSAPQAAPERPARLVLVAAVDGPALRGVVRGAGARAVDRAHGLDAVREALGEDRPVIVLPGSEEVLRRARSEVPHWHADGDDVAVLDAPTDAHVLAALAVHDPSLPVAEARRELAAAVAGVRAEVIADAADLRAAVGEAVVRLAADDDAGLVTVVVGARDRSRTDALVPSLDVVVRAAAPGAEVSVVDGGDPGYLVTVGVEA